MAGCDRGTGRRCDVQVVPTWSHNTVSAATVQVAELADRVSQLERRAGRDSSNSSKPPSSDSPYTKERQKPRDRSLRKKTGRKPGKQPGAPGSTLERVADPDETIVCAPLCCRDCSADLADAPVEAVNRRQVFDPPPPPPRPRVTEFEVQARRCGRCGTLTEGQAPPWAAGRAQYGPDTHAHAANLVCGNHIPAYRAGKLIAAMLGVYVSVGFVAGVRGKAAGLLGPFMDRVRVLLRQAEVLHADETTARAEGDLTYVHVACTEFLTHLHTGGRSAADIDAGKVLPGFTGTIVRDGYAGYHHLVEALHAWCGAHNLRDLEDVYRWDPQGQDWATRMADVLIKANKAATAARTAGKPCLDDAYLEQSMTMTTYSGPATLILADGARVAGMASLGTNQRGDLKGWSGTFRPDEASNDTRVASDGLQLELPDEQIGAVAVTGVRKVLATQVLMSLIGRGPAPF